MLQACEMSQFLLSSSRLENQKRYIGKKAEKTWTSLKSLILKILHNFFLIL